MAGVGATGFADHEHPAGDLVVDVVRVDAVRRPLWRGLGADSHRRDVSRQHDVAEFQRMPLLPHLSLPGKTGSLAALFGRKGHPIIETRAGRTLASGHEK